MGTSSARLLLTVGILFTAAACASVRPQTESGAGEPTPPPTTKPTLQQTPSTAKLPERFESNDYIVTFAAAGDTAERLAVRYLGDARKAWMIEDYAGARTFAEGREVVIPKRAWNPVGVFPWGYQLVPVLVYHNISAEQKGRLSIATSTFAAQMRRLHDEGFRAVTLREFLDFTAGKAQLPRKSVLIAFDDGYRSFLQYGRPVLKELGFSATLFVYTDYVGSGGKSLSWQDLRMLLDEGFDVQAHSKTHSNLRRQEGESEAGYAKRMETELARPLALFRTQLGRGSDTLAFPYGDVDEELLQQVTERGYLAAFTVRRQANPAFVYPLKINRSQIYAEMTLEEFARNLTVFQDENLADAAPSPAPEVVATPPTATLTIERLAALHDERSEQLESRGRLRQALEERAIALTINPRDRRAQEGLKRLEGRIAREVGNLLKEGRDLLGRGLLGEARQQFLAALSLDPTNRTAFETVQNEVREVTFIAHTVRPGDTLASVAELYYGDRFRAEVIAETNRLPMNVRLVTGRTLRIPEIPGVPILLR